MAILLTKVCLALEFLEDFEAGLKVMFSVVFLLCLCASAYSANNGMHVELVFKYNILCLCAVQQVWD